MILITVIALPVAAPAQAGAKTQLAASPPMGWNSWDCYGTSVNEAQVKANAEYMAKNLLAHGWQYIVVDIQWSEPNAHAGGYNQEPHLAMDKYGRLIPAVNRFPSSAAREGVQAAGRLRSLARPEVRYPYYAWHSAPGRSREYAC